MARPTRESQRRQKRRQRAREQSTTQPAKRRKLAAVTAGASRLREPNASTDIQSRLSATDSLVPADVSQLSEVHTFGQAIRNTTYREVWQRATNHFQRYFVDNEFGHRCDVCDRLWFLRDLKAVDVRTARFLTDHFPHESTSLFKLCSNCSRICRSQKIPSLSRTNGYQYPPKPMNLPKLDPISERLVSPRLPYMQIRRLRRDGCYGIIGQVINVPVDVDSMVKCLPRALDDDYAFNVNLKKNLIHKSSYLSGYVKKSTVKAWLQFLVQQPLYRHYNISVDWSRIQTTSPGPEDNPNDAIEPFNAVDASDAELIHAMQHTMMWNEDQCLDIAPGQHKTPESIIFDTFAEELSFPAIYYGVGRQIENHGDQRRATPYSMCTSEIRRSDRRGVTPQHVLYMAMKILRLRVRDGIRNMYRCLRSTERITRSMIEDRDFVERLVDSNQAFLKSIPNSIHYWASRKKDLFAMIRQLGKPTAFLTMSANETNWPNLIGILHRLSETNTAADTDAELGEVFDKLDRYQRAHLVAEDPVTCCIYFHKLVAAVMTMLSSQKSYNPFGRYRVIDYFLRIEFQHRGSPHAHVLLWLDNDPNEIIGETMPRTIQMMTDLCSVDRNDLLHSEMIRNQTHAHTFTCYKRGEKRCRFNIPYWPMYQTRVLMPLCQDDSRREMFKKQLLDARSRLESKAYDSIEAYLIDLKCDHDHYLDLVRSSLKRPTTFFKRDMSQIFVNTFNPWIASILNSNMDLQMILDAYSCAAYVVDYVNKSNRGISHLHRELMKIHEANPEFDQAKLMTKVGLKILNNVEMSAQEASWYLLRQRMSWASRKTISIPTMWPHERYKARKCRSLMDSEKIAPDSTEIWTKSIIQKYEDRPSALDHLTLAQYAAWYDTNSLGVDDGDDPACVDPAEETNDEVIQSPDRNYRRRQTSRIIRFRNYDREDLRNYKREMVTLYVPFRNEHVEIIDRDQFIETYEANETSILERRKEFESELDIASIMQEIKLLTAMNEQTTEMEATLPESDITNTIPRPNDDDLHEYVESSTVSAVRRRANVMNKEDYCACIRKTNAEQRELILEVIHRLHEPGRKPIQIFLTGPAGCGKTFTLKALMETYNRYSQQHNSLNNAYIATATTGKAAVGLNGVTVHAAFHLTISRQIRDLSSDTLQTYRHLLRNVQCVIVDEISMCGAHLFHSINARLQRMTGEYETNFGGMDLIACGDLKQLPPVLAAPVFSATQQTVGKSAILWQSLDFFPLTRVVRQKDARFSSILTKIGSGETLTENETVVIQSRFRTREWCATNLSSHDLRLFFNNEDVDQYNQKSIPETETTENVTALDTYTGYRTEPERREAIGKVHRMNARDTGGLPFTIRLTVGYPYMLTLNVDVEDGLVNGAIGTLRCIEHFPTHMDGTTSKRVWLEFDNTYVGRIARIKFKAHVRTKIGSLEEGWVPIELRSINIHLPKKIKCRRLQFPLSPACALTIHKSQGGTFDNIVYDYHKNHKQQLVYVALSRVTNLEGLFLTNATNDFKFYHAQCTLTPSIRDVQNEYKRLANHRLPTITCEIQKFLGSRENDGHSIIIANVNTQSLSAHTQDISTDSLLSQVDILALTETWQHTSSPPVPIQAFRLIHSVSCNERSGGVAVYLRENVSCEAHPFILDSKTCDQPTTPTTAPHIADMAITRIVLQPNKELLLITIYVHQDIGYRPLKRYLNIALQPYSKNRLQKHSSAPILLLGDFNTTETQRLKLEKYLEKHFSLKLQNDVTNNTTLGQTCIDLTFSRHMQVDCKRYVSYFSYHRPIFNKISLK